MAHRQRFNARVALVTGAGAGIGKAVALGLAAEGAAVGVFDVDEAAAQQTVVEIEAAGGRAVALPGDARRASDVADAVTGVVDAFGGVDLLASIAGIIRSAPVIDCDEETWDLVMDTNAKGAFLFSRAVLPELVERGGGAIVNAASVLAFVSQDGGAVYSASKSAIVSLTMATAIEHAADGIRVNCIAPGSVRTPLLRESAEIAGAADVEAMMEEWGRQHPLGRLIEPEDVAALVLFLLSDEASAITGSVQRVDGGLLSRLPL